MCDIEAGSGEWSDYVWTWKALGVLSRCLQDNAISKGSVYTGDVL